MKYDSKKSMVILYIISMTIAFTTQYADYEIGYGLQIIIGLLWIFLGIWKLDINGFKFRGVYKDDFPRFLKLYLLPHIRNTLRQISWCMYQLYLLFLRYTY